MQLLQRDRNGGQDSRQLVSSDACAQQILDVAPPVVRTIRGMIRSHRLPGLSVPQFRVLALLSFSPNPSLSFVADYLGSSLPAASRMVNGLVAQKLVTRCDCDHDRRQISLALTPKGQLAYRDSRRATRRQLAQSVAPLSPKQRRQVCDAMKLLGGIFGTDAECRPANHRNHNGRPAAANSRSATAKP